MSERNPDSGGWTHVEGKQHCYSTGLPKWTYTDGVQGYGEGTSASLARADFLSKLMAEEYELRQRIERVQAEARRARG